MITVVVASADVEDSLLKGYVRLSIETQKIFLRRRCSLDTIQSGRYSWCVHYELGCRPCQPALPGKVERESGCGSVELNWSIKRESDNPPFYGGFFYGYISGFFARLGSSWAVG